MTKYPRNGNSKFYSFVFNEKGGKVKRILFDGGKSFFWGRGDFFSQWKTICYTLAYTEHSRIRTTFGFMRNLEHSFVSF